MNKMFDQFTNKDAQEAWACLEEAFDLIAKRSISNLSYQELYNKQYLLVLNKQGEFAYNQLKQSVRRIFQQFVHTVQGCHKDVVIKQVVDVWEDVKYFTKIICDIFIYMDKNYVLNKQLKCVRIMQMDTFRQLMFEENQEVSQMIQAAIFEEIRKDRDGQLVERMKLKTTLEMLIEIDLSQQQVSQQFTYSVQKQYQYSNSDRFYKQFFEQKLLRETSTYYQKEGAEVLKTRSVREYIEHVKNRLDAEVERARAYMNVCSEKAIKEVFLTNMVVAHAQHCIKQENQGLHFFLDNDQESVLKDMYGLFKQTTMSMEIFLDGLGKYIIQRGSQILDENKLQNDASLVLEKLISLHEQIDQQVKNCFSGGVSAQQLQLFRAMRDAFEQVVNKDNFVIIQLNKSLDSCFRKDFKSASNDEVDARLRRCFQIFRLIKQKDIFEHYYKKSLCRRLIEGTSLSDEYERLFVGKMKVECGSTYTSKLETMFKDIEISKSEIMEFRKNIRQIAHGAQKPSLASIDLEIQILTLGHWPLQDPLVFNLAEELKFWRNAFERHYVGANKQRKLTWFSNFGFVDLKAFYPQGKKKEFITTTLQGCLLLLFNTIESASLKEICDRLDVPFEVLRRELGTLFQHQVLTRNSNDETINPTDIVTCNVNFQHRNYKLKLIPQYQEPQGMTKSRQASAKKEDDAVDDQEVIIERKFILESMIVRIMKTRRQLEHTKLLQEVYALASQKHFVPDNLQIKQCLESLMSREYLSRSEANNELYIYRA